MPRRKREAMDLSGLTLNRTVGLEIEGYSKTNPRRIINDGGIPHCEIKRDGSLSNYYWSDEYKTYGVEIVTEPIKQLELLNPIFELILGYGWSASGRASLHIHVDAGGYQFRDRLKLLHFAKRVEDVMLLFTKNRRYNNRYCKLIPSGHLQIFNNPAFKDVNNYSALYNVARYTWGTGRSVPKLVDSRYHWVNALNSHHDTIEFRMFHPIKSAEEGAKFATLVHNFVEMVHGATIQQLDFIADSIDNEQDINKKAQMLLSALDIPFELPILNAKAINSILAKQRVQIGAIV